MKNYQLIPAVILFISVVFTSFTTLKVEKKVVDTAKSRVEWLGTKVTGKHMGTIQLKSGTLLFSKKKPVGGDFVVDMTSIVCEDLNGDSKGKLERHLSSDDFFGVANFPESTFKITKVTEIAKNKFKVSGNLTIKGITLENSVDLVFTDNTATGTLIVDRTKYGIRYGSGSFFDNLGDKAIHDNFELKISLAF